MATSMPGGNGRRVRHFIGRFSCAAPVCASCVTGALPSSSVPPPRGAGVILPMIDPGRLLPRHGVRVCSHGDVQVRWSVVVPAKRLAVAKTRLRPLTGGTSHDDWVLAMLADTVAAAVA